MVNQVVVLEVLFVAVVGETCRFLSQVVEAEIAQV